MVPHSVRRLEDLEAGEVLCGVKPRRTLTRAPGAKHLCKVSLNAIGGVTRGKIPAGAAEEYDGDDAEGGRTRRRCHADASERLPNSGQIQTRAGWPTVRAGPRPCRWLPR
jgi:hypothetical protein